MRLSAGSQSEQSEQYESSLLHGDGERWCVEDVDAERLEGERVSCGRSESIGGVGSLYDALLSIIFTLWR